MTVLEILDEVRREIEAADPNAQEAEGPVEEGEEIVGYLTDDMKRTFGVGRQLSKEKVRLHREHFTAHLERRATEETCSAFHATEQSLKRRGQIVHGLLWEAITRAFPKVASAPVVTIREGWAVVIPPETSTETIPELFKNAFVVEANELVGFLDKFLGETAGHMAEEGAAV